MNVYLLFFTFTQRPFWSVCWPDASLYDLFGRQVAQTGLWKWISCLYKYRFCIIQSFLSWKGSEIQCLGILCAIDLLKHLVEEAEALEGDRMWVLCEMRRVCSSQLKTREYVSSLMCWNSSQVWSEGFGKQMGWREGNINLNWNDRLVEASLMQEAQPWIWVEYLWLFQQAQLFIYSFQQISLE